MLHTTFNRLKLAGACGQKRGSGEGYDKLATTLGGTEAYEKNTPIPFPRILESNGLSDTLWCLQATIEDYQTVVKPFIRRLMADYLEHLMLVKLSKKSITLLAEGVALLRDLGVTDRQLAEYARKVDEAAGAARDAARAAGAAAWAAALAARDADLAALAARAARDAAWAARAAAGAARDAARAARDAETTWQSKHLVELLEEEPHGT